MSKTKKILWAILLLWLIMAITPVYSAEIVKSEFIYLKNGSIIECDKAWIAGEDIVRFKKGHDEILYSTDEVDIKKTFGESEAKRLEERKFKEEKELLRPMVSGTKLFRWPDSYIKAGIVIFTGDTTYQIGGKYVTPSTSGKYHFPISELEFPLDVEMFLVEGGKKFAEKWNVRAGVKKNISTGAGKMKDSDWLTQSDPARLDVYSESDAELDALIMDINLRCRFYEKSNWSLIAGVGYIHQNFDYETRINRQWSPSGLAGYDYTGAGNVSLTYEVTYNIPYFEIGTQLNFKDKFSVEASLGYSPIVDAEDFDVHVLRAKTAEGDCDGDAIIFSLKGRYNFTRNWFLDLQYDYTKIDTDGTQKQYTNGAWTGTIDQEITSEQISGVLSVGYAF